MELSLKVVAGKFAGKEIRVSTAKFVIGRADDCHLRAQSELISRHHCALLVEPYLARVEDLGSRNGTLLNDEPIQGPRELRSGDTLTIGQLKFEVHLKSGLGGLKRPTVVDVQDAAQRTVETIPENDDSEVANWIKEPPPATGAMQAVPSAETLSAMANGGETLIGRSHDDEETPVHGSRGERPRPAAASAAQAKDSQEAAAEILRKFMKNRR